MNNVHPLARAYLKKIEPFRIVSNFRHGITEMINTSSAFDDYSKYPDIENKPIKKKYIGCIKIPKSISITLTEENILFTSGASEAINLILQAFCDPYKDSVCVTPPTFTLYEELANRHQVDVEKITLLGKHFDSLDFAELKKSNAKVIYLCSPNNPVGTELKFYEIHYLLSNTRNSIVVIDETYVDFSSNQELLTLLSEFDNLIFIRSFSKAWGLAGVRAGAVIASKSIIDLLRLIQLPFSFSEPAQESLSKRFEQIDAIQKSIDEFAYLRKKLTDFLIGLHDVETIYPSSTNFVTACFSHHDQYLKLLTSQKLLVTSLHEVIPKAIRLSIYDRRHVKNLISTISIMININKDTHV
jgi:histidinol-phosphate aminotransferase